jgi:hypothetical protein
VKATDKLRVYYMKRERDIGGWHPLGRQTQCDLGWLLHEMKHILAELEARGYDTKTLKLSVEPQQGNERFASQRKGGPSHG